MLNPYLAIAPELPQGTCEVIVERVQHDGYVLIWHRVTRSYVLGNDLLQDPAHGMTWSSIAEASGVSSRPILGGAGGAGGPGGGSIGSRIGVGGGAGGISYAKAGGGMSPIMADCRICQLPRTFRHIHDTVHGIPGTHMVGSERFTCNTCGTSTYASDNDGQFDFVLDKS